MTKMGMLIMGCATIMLVVGIALLIRNGSSQAWISIATAGVFFGVAAAVGRRNRTGTGS